MKTLRTVAMLLLLCGAMTFAAGQSVTDKPPRELTLDCGNGQALKLISIPAGEFMMGSPATLPGMAIMDSAYTNNNPMAAPNDEQPQHKVRITRPFYLGLFTVTQAQYEAVMGTNPSRYKSATRPVEMVSWKDAVDFCAKLSAKSGRQVRLPTEAEWEYACRAGTTGPWYTDETLSMKRANIRELWKEAESEEALSTSPVGSYPPNPWGLYDMLGNVGQWVQDCYDEGYYKVSPVDDPTGPVGGALHAARGGAFNGTCGECRSALRKYSLEPWMERDWTTGFRVVCVCTPEESKTAPQAKELEALVKARPAATGPAHAEDLAVDETLAHKLDGTYYHREAWKPAKAPERFTSEKRKVTCATPNGPLDKEITYYKNALGMEFVLVPAGEFLMGTDGEYMTGCAAYTSWHTTPDKYPVFSDEKPRHTVRITRPFFMGSLDVTFAQYYALMGPRKTSWRSMFGRQLLDGFNFKNPPVTEVTWYDAVEFCKRLSAKTGRLVRLPTEAEWEYACRAGTTSLYYTGERLSYKQANIWADWMDADGTIEVPHEKVHYQQVSVGSYQPNPWGLYDMHGLVWQWCQDWYDQNYFKVSPVDDPTGPTNPVKIVVNQELGVVLMKKVLRGGSWDSYPAECRSAIRMEAVPLQGWAQNWGFRIVIECTPEEIKAAANAAATAPK